MIAAVGATLAQMQVSSKLYPAFLSSQATKKLDDMVEAY